MPRPRATRDLYRHFHMMTTRWRDNDVFGHVNNVVYLEYVDTCVNAWLLETGALDVLGGDVVGLAVESACTYFASLSFPGLVEAGLRVARLGNTSVTYEVGLFGEGEAEAAAVASFTHVYVGRETRRPVPLPEGFREALRGLE
jgi:acyl-CoA thioester hydrolase